MKRKAVQQRDAPNKALAVPNRKVTMVIGKQDDVYVVKVLVQDTENIPPGFRKIVMVDWFDLPRVYNLEKVVRAIIFDRHRDPLTEITISERGITSSNVSASYPRYLHATNGILLVFHSGPIRANSVWSDGDVRPYVGLYDHSFTGFLPGIALKELGVEIKAMATYMNIRSLEANCSVTLTIEDCSTKPFQSASFHGVGETIEFTTLYNGNVDVTPYTSAVSGKGFYCMFPLATPGEWVAWSSQSELVFLNSRAKLMPSWHLHAPKV